MCAHVCVRACVCTCTCVYVCIRVCMCVTRPVKCTCRSSSSSLAPDRPTALGSATSFSSFGRTPSRILQYSIARLRSDDTDRDTFCQCSTSSKGDVMPEKLSSVEPLAPAVASHDSAKGARSIGAATRSIQAKTRTRNDCGCHWCRSLLPGPFLATQGDNNNKKDRAPRRTTRTKRVAQLRIQLRQKSLKFRVQS